MDEPNEIAKIIVVKYLGAPKICMQDEHIGVPIK